MNEYKLPPLVEQVFQRIGLIYEGYQLISRYSVNPYLPRHLRKMGFEDKSLYIDLLIRELDLVKAILLEEMEIKEDSPCQE